VAFSDAMNATHSYPRARKSNPSNSGSPRPSRTGAIAMCSSSMRPSRRYCWIVSGPPPIRTSIPAAASRARSSASRMPPVRRLRQCNEWIATAYLLGSTAAASLISVLGDLGHILLRLFWSYVAGKVSDLPIIALTDYCPKTLDVFRAPVLALNSCTPRSSRPYLFTICT
jgi:hypothetical protein